MTNLTDFQEIWKLVRVHESKTVQWTYTAIQQNSRWWRTPCWIKKKCYNFWTIQPIVTIFYGQVAWVAYFTKNRSNITFSQNPRWRRLPSCKLTKCDNFWTVPPIVTIFDGKVASVTHFLTNWWNITFRKNPRWRQHHLGNIQSAITFKSFNSHLFRQKNLVWSCFACKTELVICINGAYI